MEMKRSRLGRMALPALAATGVGIYALAPGVATGVLPYALLAACPASMLLMMKYMHGGQGTRQGTPQGTPREDRAGPEQEESLARLKAQQAALDEKIGALEREGYRPSAEKDGNPTDEGARTS